MFRLEVLVVSQSKPCQIQYYSKFAINPVQANASSYLTHLPKKVVVLLREFLEKIAKRTREAVFIIVAECAARFCRLLYSGGMCLYFASYIKLFGFAV